MPQAIYYSYAYPEPPGFAGARISPAEASYDQTMHEFVLPYEAVRRAANPDDMILQFAESVYDQTCRLARWDRASLEEKKPALRSP